MAAYAACMRVAPIPSLAKIIPLACSVRPQNRVMQTYVAEISGRPIFAFRSIDVSCAQAWLDIYGVMRRSLERLQSGGQAIWDGQAAIVARKATSDELILWNRSSDRVAHDEQIEELDSIMVWLIPTPQDPARSQAPAPASRRASRKAGEIQVSPNS